MTATGTLGMTVRNVGFMIERLGQDCSPLQYIRELTQNSIEAIAATPGRRGVILWDVDWNRHKLTGIYKLAIIDTGIGMTGEEMVKYLNALSSSVHTQTMTGNYGVGAKIAAATRNHEGLIYLSWKDSIGYMAHLWRDPDSGEYGLRQLELPDGTFAHWSRISDDIKHPAIGNHGTMVILLGNELGADTMQPPADVPRPSRWIARYLNTRYFEFPENVSVKAREAWDAPSSSASDGTHSQLRTVTGQKPYLDKNSVASGEMELTDATAHWWILKDDPSVLSSTYPIQSTGHMAALYQNELYEMVTGRSGTARLQSFGVIFGHQRVVIYVKPHENSGASVTSNTARTLLLLNGEMLPWADWAAEFRSELPDPIRELVEAVGNSSTAADHRQAIKERLKQLRDLFRVSRYRPTSNGDMTIAEESFTKGGEPEVAAPEESPPKTPPRPGGSGTGGRAGDVYALFLATDGLPADEVKSDPDPEVKWVSVLDGTRVSPDLEDRAAKYLLEQNLLIINADFRVFADMEKRWIGKYQDIPGAEVTVRDVLHEWFEQALIETVIGTQALRNARYWSIDEISKALSEESLTAAVMPRYHIDMAARRALGSKLGTLRGVA